MCLCKRWLSATIEELSSIVICVFGSVKTCFFPLPFLLSVEHYGRNDCNLSLAAKLYLRNNQKSCMILKISFL